jgi:hypothetical protein
MSISIAHLYIHTYVWICIDAFIRRSISTLSRFLRPGWGGLLILCMHYSSGDFQTDAAQEYLYLNEVLVRGPKEPTPPPLDLSGLENVNFAWEIL